MTEERMCVVCGVRPANSLMTRRLQKEGVGLYCSGDCARAASKNFKRRMNGDTVAKLVLTLKNLTEQYSGTVSGNQWLNAFREQYKSQRAFERTVALTSGIRAIANRENIEINENSTKSWTFKYLGGNTISEWLKPSMRAKFDEIRLEVGGTAAEGLETSETSEVSAAETKLSKTSCCCGATEDKPCACMMAPEPMKCSAVEPMCPCYAALADSKSAETFEAETMTKAQAKKRFLALMKPYWLKDFQQQVNELKKWLKKEPDDEGYVQDDMDWWNDHIKTVETGKYAMASTSGDTVLREALPYSYYAFINLLPIEWKGHEKYDEEPYDTDEYLLNDDWCIYRREIPWSEWSAADRRKYNKLNSNSSEMDYQDYVEQLSEIESKYDKTVHHKSEAAKMKCKHCGPYYSNMNNMNNWDILSVVENPDFYEYWDYPASLKKQVKALIPALKGVKAKPAAKPKKAPAKPAAKKTAPVKAKKPAAKAKSKPKAKAKSGRKGPDISATKRKIGTRMRGNDGKMWEVKPAGKSQRWVRGAETFEASRGGRGHQLMTKELSAKIPKLYSQEEVEDPIVVAHYFSPYARQADWFVIEWDGEDLMFGLADLGYPELGYWTLTELESARRGSLPLVERDLHWTPVPLSEVRKTRMSAEGDSPSRDNDQVAVGDLVRSYDFVLPNGELIRDDCYAEGRVTKIDSWEWCGPNCDHFFILIEKIVSRGKEVAIPPGIDMCYPPVNESFVQIISRKEAEMREEYGCDRCGEEVADGNARYPKVSGDDDDTRICEDCYFEDSQFSIYEAQSWKSCAMCGEPASFTVYDTPVGIRNFCCERCYAQYVGLPVEEPGYYGLEAEDWNWGGDPDGPLAKALRRAKNSPKKTKPLELVRLDDLEESKDAETWYGPFGIETRTATGQFKKWEKVETYEKLIDRLNQMFNEEGFAPYALDVYAERMPRAEMTRSGPVVVNDRKVLLATYKYGVWESGPWRHLMPRPNNS